MINNVSICQYDWYYDEYVKPIKDKIDSFLEDTSRPFIVIMGGKKVSDKIKVIDNLIKKCDKLLIGGAMSFTFLHVLGYNVNMEYVDNDSISYVKGLLDKYKDKIVLPVDFMVSSSLEDVNSVNKSLDELEVKFREFGLVNKVTMMCDKLTGKPKT